jgi:enediyne biosynthesis protein E4
MVPRPAILSIIVFAALLSLPACTRRQTSNTKEVEPPWFEDFTASAGLDFKHDVGPTGTFFMPESAGSGGALFDFDNDGRLDIYLVHNVSPSSKSKNRLYHQEPDGRFRDVSEGSGLDVTGYGMGVTVGDVNNDGLPDLFLTEYGNVRLFRNCGEGKFEDVTRAAGIDNTRWATAASFCDYDRDGWLDLIIVNYLDYTHTVKCHDTRGMLEFCGPQGMQGTAARLFHNLAGARGSTRAAEADTGGRGSTRASEPRFEDVSVTSGIAKKTGPGLGVLCADFDGDHWPDIFIADDGMPNRLFMNQRNGTFREEAAQRGIAYNAFGSPVANMGVAVGDVDSDGLFDIFVTHVSWEQHALWKQGPAGLFQDQTAASGLSNLKLRGTAFGTVLTDFDCDGALDLALVNGRIKRDNAAGRGVPAEPLLPGLDSFWHPYAQRNQLFANEGTGRFRDVSDANPALCGTAGVARGLACGDIDNDGDLDLLVVNTGASAQLLRNVAPKRKHWLMIRAIDPALGGRDMYGTEITVTAGPKKWKRLVQPSYSYLVSNDPRAHFGLGASETFDHIQVVWPDGTQENFPGGKADQFLVLRKTSKP